MKNTLADLNNYLFEQLERINDDELKGDDLDTELKKADAIVGIAGKVIEIGNLEFKVLQHKAEYGYKNATVPLLLEESDGET